MSTQSPSESTFPLPILSDWTIERLLEWFAEDDERLSDASLRGPLRALEESLTGSRWTRQLDASLSGTRVTREPAIVSLVRSIALHTGSHPALRARTIGELTADGEGAPDAQTAAAAASSSLVATS